MRRQTLLKKLVVSFILVSLIPALLTAGVTFYRNNRDLKASIISENQLSLLDISERTSEKIQQVDMFFYWVSQNTQIQQLLNLTASEAASYSEDKALAIKELRSQTSYRPIAKDMLSLFIIGNNGLDIRDGAEASLIDYTYLKTFINRFSEDYWSGVMENITPLTDNKRVIMYCHPIISLESRQTIGHLMIIFSENFFLDAFKYFTEDSDNYAALFTENGQILALAGCEGDEIKVLTMLSSKNQNSEYLPLTVIDNANRLTLRGLVSKQLINNQVHLLTTSTIVLLAIVVGVTAMLSTFLSVNLNHPIKQITKNVNKISKGDFTHLQEIDDNSELGELNRHILKMSEDIQRLLQEQKERETEKRRLEVRVLQAQINPHFLYNTLNSIKIMASMQSAYNISAMVDALGKLIRANQTVTAEWIPLKQELDLLDSYLYIQNIRFKGKIRSEWSIEDESLLQQKILKFTLQPLVENAIIHGLADLPQGGEILIICDTHKTDLRIRILDDGVGIEPDRLAYIQAMLNDSSGIFHQENGMGIKNVAQRIRLRCGSRYGVTISNRAEGGTCATVLLPLDYNESQNHQVEQIEMQCSLLITRRTQHDEFVKDTHCG